jgi:hypothetical protein
VLLPTVAAADPSAAGSKPPSTAAIVPPFPQIAKQIATVDDAKLDGVLGIVQFDEEW